MLTTHPQTLAHLSDLHFGETPVREDVAHKLVRTLIHHRIDRTVISGDLTHGGWESEYLAFTDTFGDLLARHCVTVVPGNHDRAGDNVADILMPVERVQVEHHPGLTIIKLDSTAPHNRVVWWGHGLLTPEDLARLELALEHVPRDTLVVLVTHHHPYPLPEEGLLEHVSWRLGLPFTHALSHGDKLLELLLGRVDLVLHGHRHVPTVKVIPGPRPLAIYNAGSSTEIGGFRLFRHQNGRLCDLPSWLLEHP